MSWKIGLSVPCVDGSYQVFDRRVVQEIQTDCRVFRE